MKRTLEVKVVLIISLLLFIASLGMPALEFREHPPVQGPDKPVVGLVGRAHG